MKEQVKEKKINQKYFGSNGGEEKLSEAILNYVPSDVIVEILTKLPLKSLVRFRCVSKLWSSLINESIKIRSLTQPPSLLVIFDERSSYFFLASTYPLNTNTTFISADKEGHRGTNGIDFHFVFRYVNGLICCRPRKDQFAIYNPTTKQYVWLPPFKYDKSHCFVDGLFGYDPVENRYKVLCFTLVYNSHEYHYDCHVFTLPSTKKQRWRNIGKSQNNFFTPDVYANPSTSSVCINGIIYYIGFGSATLEYVKLIGRFDVRLERFDHISLPESWMNNNIRDFTLVNYQGKLGCIPCNNQEESTTALWIMEDDIEKQEWSKIRLFMPYYSKAYCIAGVTRNGEIVSMPRRLKPDETLYAYFYDPKQTKTRKVELENSLQTEVGIHSEPDHIENTMHLVSPIYRSKKKPTTILPFPKKHLLVIAFFCAALVWLATVVIAI